MQTSAMAEQYRGFYSADEFTLDRLGPEVLGNATEVGRACVGREFRNRHVLFLLWKGLAAYLSHTRKRFLFGCCSLTSQDPVEGKHVMDFLERRGYVDTRHAVGPQPGWECYPQGYRPEPAEPADEVRLPKLFNLYMRIGAKVCGEPAIDRLFKTIDYFVLFDLDDLDDQHRRMFFGRE
jgi:putative hemolysin